MAKTYTADQLVDLTRNRARLPDVAAQGSADSDVLEALNEAMFNELLPWVMGFREEYFVVTERVTLSANQKYVPLPIHAAGQKIRRLEFRTTSTSLAGNLSHISAKEAPDYDSQSGNPTAYYFEGNQHLVLVPQNATAGNLLDVSYFRTPGELVLVANTAVIQSVDSTTQVTATAALPSTFTSSLTYDIHSSQSGAAIRSQGLTVNTLGSNTITFNELIDGSVFGTHAVEVGDYICLAGEAAVPGLPRELHPVLAQSAAVLFMHNEQDTEALKNASAMLNRQLQQCKSLLDDRSEAQPKKIHGRGRLLWKQGSYSSWY